MKRSTLLAAIAASTILLASCGSGAATSDQGGSAIEKSAAAERSIAAPAAASGRVPDTTSDPENGDSASDPESGASVLAMCSYDPEIGIPNPMGMRSAITLTEVDGSTTFLYEQFPQTVRSSSTAEIAVTRSLVLFEQDIESARALMRENSDLYDELIGDADPAGYSTVDESLTCTSA